jgi:hypothetical protein
MKPAGVRRAREREDQEDMSLRLKRRALLGLPEQGSTLPKVGLKRYATQAIDRPDMMMDE